MRYKFDSIHVNVTKYDVTFSTKRGSNPLCGYATGSVCYVITKNQFDNTMQIK